MVAAVLVVLALTACGSPQPTTLTRAVYTMNKAIPNYDGRERTVTDAAKLRDLANLLDRHSVHGSVSRGDVCPGSTSAALAVVVVDGSVWVIRVGDCGHDAFATAVIDLLERWKG